jgi:enoyl-CoA hydratase/carnithine racemase
MKTARQEEEVLSLSVENGVATVRMARAHGNAINEPMAEALLKAYEKIRADDSAQGVILTSRGKLFCPGLDLQELIEYDRPSLERFLNTFRKCLMSMYSIQKPVVAALSGHALAGGCVFALTADWRVLQRDALIGLNEVQVGVPLPWSVIQILKESVTPSRLEEIALLGRNYSNDAAVGAGLAHELADPEKVEARARERLEEFMSKDTAALGITKRYLRDAAVLKIRETDAERAGDFLDSWFSPGTQSRIRKIVEGLQRRGK